MLSNGIGGTVLPIVMLLLVIAAAYYTTRFVSVKANRINRGKYLRVIDRLMVGRDKHILMVEAGEQVYLLGVSRDNMTAIGSLTKEQLQDFSLTEDTQSVSVTSGFQNIFNRIREFSQHDNRRRNSVVNWQKKRTPQPPDDQYDQTDQDDIDMMLQAMNKRRERIRQDFKSKGGKQ